MKWILLLSLVYLIACANHPQQQISTEPDTSIQHPDTPEVNQTPVPDTSSTRTYGNQRFKDVTIERIGVDSFVVRGKAQVFEAAFSWVVEDGHDELKQGFQMTDAGAPAWGNFTFGLRVPKKQENSTLTLILFESSPKDGSRQYELPISLSI